MRNITVTDAILARFQRQLLLEEKSRATIAKYMRDLRAFSEFSGGRPLSKSLTLDYKESLRQSGYAASSINSMLASLNKLLSFLGAEQFKVKSLRLQRRVYSKADAELSRDEYLRLLRASKDKLRLNLLLQTICGTGIRVSELRFFTVEGAKRGEISVSCKGKTRSILIPRRLCSLLLRYCGENGIKSGLIFRTRSGKALDRSNIWAEMKKLCAAAGVAPAKVFPHNLRKLFARCFYALEKDIAKLADVLGHSSIDTTRIYIMSTGFEHRLRLERLGLVV